MSDIGRSLERWLAWVNLSPWRALLIIVPVFLYIGGLAIWSYNWSGAAIRDLVGRGLPADDGVFWASIFVGSTLPAVVFSASLMLFVAVKRWWTLVLMVVAFAPGVFSATVNPSGILGRTRRISRSIEELTRITGDAHVAQVIDTAVRAGKIGVCVILLGSIFWVYTLRRRRRFPDASASHRAVQDDRQTLGYERGMLIFRWGYPFAVVAAIPLIALAGAANAS